MVTNLTLGRMMWTEQPLDLRVIIWLVINKVMANALHACTYIASCGAHWIQPLCYSSAKSLNHIPYAKWFALDFEFAKTISWVVSTVSLALVPKARSLTIVKPDQKLNGHVLNYHGVKMRPIRDP